MIELYVASLRRVAACQSRAAKAYLNPRHPLLGASRRAAKIAEQAREKAWRIERQIAASEQRERETF